MAMRLMRLDSLGVTCEMIEFRIALRRRVMQVTSIYALNSCKFTWPCDSPKGASGSRYSVSMNPSTTISFTTTRAGHVTAKIYDVSGHLVRTLADRTLGGGRHTLPWNGSTENGSRAASGVYFVKLRAPDGEAAKCLVLMK